MVLSIFVLIVIGKYLLKSCETDKLSKSWKKAARRGLSAVGSTNSFAPLSSLSGSISFSNARSFIASNKTTPFSECAMMRVTPLSLSISLQKRDGSKQSHIVMSVTRYRFLNRHVKQLGR